MDDENNATAAAEEDDIVGDVVGAEYIKPVKGLFCKLCKKFFPSDKSEVEAHCSSSQHMDSVSLIEKQTGIKRKPAAEFFEWAKIAKQIKDVEKLICFVSMIFKCKSC